MTQLPHVDGVEPTDNNDIASPSTNENGARTNGTCPHADAAESVELNIRDPNFMACAHAIYAELQAHGPVSRVHFAGFEDEEQNGFFPRDAHFVSHYDEVIATLLDDRFSVKPSRPTSGTTTEPGEQAPEIPEELRLFARNILSLDPPDHTRLRKLVQPSFTGRAMEALRGNIQQIVDDLLDKAERDAAARGEVAPNRCMDLIEAFAYPMPVTVISDMLGIPREDREMIRGWTENLLRLDRARGRRLDDQTRAGLRDFTAYLRDLLQHKRRQPADDMISRLVHAQEDGNMLDDDEVVSMVFILFLAGHVTTVNLISNGVVALFTHPDQLAKFKADPGLTKGVVEETLRYWGPVDFISRRTAKENLELSGTAIAAGEAMAVGLAAANRDPAQFPNPDVFDITRANANLNVAFGKGIHVCLGAPLARVEGQVAFGTLFRRFPELRLAVSAEEVRWGGNFLRGFAHLPVLF